MPREIIFGYETAIQICRSSRTNLKNLVIPHARLAPAKMPSPNELGAAVQQLKNHYPHVQIVYPLHCMVNSTIRLHPTIMTHPHRFTSPLPGSSLYRLADGIFAATPPLAFIQECARRSFVDQLRLAWEICGIYQSGFCGLPSEYDIKPLASVENLRSYAQRNSSLSKSRAARQALQYTADGSASTRESQLSLSMSLPKLYGGGGLGTPSMNFEVETTPQARTIYNRRTIRCDIHWPGTNIDVEYQSHQHHSGDEKRIEDSRRTNALKAMGFDVHLITDDELNSFATTEALICTLRKSLGKRDRTKIDDYHARKLKLRRELGLPVGFE